MILLVSSTAARPFPTPLATLRCSTQVAVGHTAARPVSDTVSARCPL